jgi:anthranilate phosphoribosyltransferase
VDQSHYAPRLHALTALRSLIVKRPAITTVETLVGPIRARKLTHTLTGYVHKPYPRIYAMLARHAGFDSALIVRGVEGGVIPSLRQEGKLFWYRDKGEEQALEINPADFGIDQGVRAVPVPGNLGKAKEGGDEIAVAFDTANAAQAAADTGLAALAGAPGATRDGLTYATAICLWHLKRFPTLGAAATHVRSVLDSGNALARFKAGS